MTDAGDSGKWRMGLRGRQDPAAGWMRAMNVVEDVARGIELSSPGEKKASCADAR